MRPSLSTAASIVEKRAVAEVAALRCSSRSSTHFHRRARLTRCEAHQHDIGKHRLLHAEAAARIARRLVTQTIRRHIERHRHHGVQRKRTHEIRGDVVAFVARQILRDHHAAFDRRTRIARVVRDQLHPMRRLFKRCLRIAVAEMPVADHVRADAVVQHRRIVPDRLFDRCHRIEHRVFDLDEIERIFRKRPRFGHHHGHRLADITHAIHRERPLLHGGLHADDKRPRPCVQIVARKDSANARQLRRRLRIDRYELCVRVRRAQHCGVQCAGLDRDVVAVAAAAGQDRGIFEALHRAADVALRRWLLLGACVDSRERGLALVHRAAPSSQLANSSARPLQRRAISPCSMPNKSRMRPTV